MHTQVLVLASHVDDQGQQASPVLDPVFAGWADAAFFAWVQDMSWNAHAGTVASVPC
jgi:hypothetical protein